MSNIFNSLLSNYNVSRELSKGIREDIRKPLESIMGNNIDAKISYRYGGSLAKGTANSNSCDIDMLCYVDSSSNMSVENIYRECSKNLFDNHYNFIEKNSAIKVTGKSDEKKWEFTVDIVPGKYTNNKDNSDVYLWRNEDKQRLLTNPEIQINKVKSCNSKEVIRIIKLFREFNNFKFKSFYLEIFAIDLVEANYNEGDSIIDKLIHFCDSVEEIGNTRVYDPANKNNDIMILHTQKEYEIIQSKIKKLEEALKTDNDECIKNCILGKSYDIENAYALEAKSHSSTLKLDLNSNHVFNITALFYLDNSKKITFNSNQKIARNYELEFYIKVPNNIHVTKVEWTVSNAGLEARKNSCLRGEVNQTSHVEENNNQTIFRRDETSEYYGNHYVQGIIYTNNKVLKTNYFIVNIR